MKQNAFDLGIIGLGTMGRNLLLNFADKGFSVCGHDSLPDQNAALEAQGLPAFSHLRDFLHALAHPRKVLLMVPAGAAVDQIMQQLLPMLDTGDILVDLGNSHFQDTLRRQAACHEQGLLFLGTGISGGEKGARYGPSIMAGGPQSAWEATKNIWEAAGASVDGVPCAACLGPGAEGHYVKMVHNGIEYGHMQLIAEVYDILKRGNGWDNDRIAGAMSAWDASKLPAYLHEITLDILRTREPGAGNFLLDQILDHSRQKGTGKWVSAEALERAIPIPTIDAAVSARTLSGMRTERHSAQILYTQTGTPFAEIPAHTLEEALRFGVLSAYAQGFQLLNHLDQAAIASVWRGGCIIRSPLLERFRTCFQEHPALSNLLLHPAIAKECSALLPAARACVGAAVNAGLPVPALSASVAWLDTLRSAQLPANLIQAQRDYFGAHRFERRDRPGEFHLNWQK